MSSSVLHIHEVKANYMEGKKVSLNNISNVYFFCGIHGSTLHLRYEAVSVSFFPWTFSVSFTYVACWIGERTFLHLTFDLVYYVLVTGFPPNYVSHFSAFDWVYYVIHTGFPPAYVISHISSFDWVYCVILSEAPPDHVSHCSVLTSFTT